MKKLKLSPVAVLVAVIALTGSAFTDAIKNKPIDDPQLHWFRTSDGAYRGLQLTSVMEAGECAGEVQECAKGYEQITGLPGSEQPVTTTLKKTIKKS